jgi:predicted DNA-binding protein (UPF0251 family)
MRFTAINDVSMNTLQELLDAPTVTPENPFPVVPATAALSPATVSQTIPESLLETALDPEYHEAYKLRLSGMPVHEIAKKLGVDRTTIWRRCREVEREFASQLEKTPQFNILAVEIKRLIDLEELSRQFADNSKSERAKALHIGNAIKACQARQKLLLDAGVLEREPTKIFSAIVDLKTASQNKKKPGELRSREELIEDVIRKLGNATQF